MSGTQLEILQRMFKLRILDTHQYSTVDAIDLEIIYKIYERSWGGSQINFANLQIYRGYFH